MTGSEISLLTENSRYLQAAALKDTNQRYLKIYIYYISMENQKIKRGRGRPKVFSDEERKNHKTKYMLSEEWYCDTCKMGRNYTLAGKHCHLNTKKHLNNTNVTQKLNT